MSVGSWMGTIILLAIPVVNVICFFVWMFSGNKDRRNYLLATLFVAIIVVVLSVVLTLVGGTSLIDSLQAFLNSLIP